MHSWTDSKTNPIDIKWCATNCSICYSNEIHNQNALQINEDIDINDKQNPKIAYEERRQESEEIAKSVPAQNSYRKWQHLGALPM